MPNFSNRSKNNLLNAHPDLRVLFYEVILDWDCIVLESFRGQVLQDEAYKKGNSKLKWPNSKHNSYPSHAVDVAPYKSKIVVDWSDIKRMYYFAGFVMCTAKRLKKEGRMQYDVRWGGDWDSDTEVLDQKFNDLVHFELIIK